MVEVLNLDNGSPEATFFLPEKGFGMSIRCLKNNKSCPYCGKSIKSIKKPIKQTETNINLGCNSIIKSGTKKGLICGRINCNYHKIKI